MTLDWALAKRLAVGLLLMVATTRYFDTGTAIGALVRLVGELLGIFLVLWAPGVALLSLRWRYALSEADAQLMAVPLTVALYCASFVLLYAISAPVAVYVLVYLGGFAAACGVLVRRLRAGHAIRLPESYLLAFLLALAAACFLCSSVSESPWRAITWEIPARRATHALPSDNGLQWDGAQVFIHGGEPWAWSDGYWNWSMGDRPALFAALTALCAKSFLAYRRIRFFDYTLIGIVLNILYVVPCAHLARRIIRSDRLALWAVLSLALTPNFFVNVYYTWPKLLGVFFTMTALAFFLKRPSDDAWAWPQPRAGALLGVVLSLAAQAHAGSVLSAPFLLLAITLFGANWAPRKLIGGAAALVATSLLTAVPWWAYKAAHPRIQTNNLAYHYRPYLDRPGNSIPLAQWWAQYPLDKQLTLRWGNVQHVFESSEFAATVQAYLTGPLEAFYAGRWHKEFFHPVSQVDELRIMLAAAAAAMSLAMFVHKRLRGKAELVFVDRKLNLAALITLLLLPFLSYLWNAFMKWEEIQPHALPVAEIVCICLALALLVLSTSRVLAYLLLWSVAARFTYFIVVNTVPTQLFGTYGLCLLTVLGLLPWLFGSAHGKDARTTE